MKSKIIKINTLIITIFGYFNYLNVFVSFKSILPINWKRLNKNYLLSIIDNHIIYYPTPITLTYAWSFGSLAGICLVIQMLSGIFLAIHYTPNIDLAFLSVEHIMRDVKNGWLIRYIHANGASMFFIVVYFYIFRGLYYGSCMIPRELLWCSGVVIFILMMANVFNGYVLPCGQMSFWGATVITSLVTVIPVADQPIVEWLLGGYTVNNPTLQSFFSINFCLPFVIAGLTLIHLVLLHKVGSNSPIGLDIGVYDIPCYPYFFIFNWFKQIKNRIILNYMIILKNKNIKPINWFNIFIFILGIFMMYKNNFVFTIYCFTSIIYLKYGRNLYILDYEVLISKHKLIDEELILIKISGFYLSFCILIFLFLYYKFKILVGIGSIFFMSILYILQKFFKINFSFPYLVNLIKSVRKDNFTIRYHWGTLPILLHIHRINYISLLICLIFGMWIIKYKFIDFEMSIKLFNIRFWFLIMIISIIYYLLITLYIIFYLNVRSAAQLLSSGNRALFGLALANTTNFILVNDNVISPNEMTNVYNALLDRPTFDDSAQRLQYIAARKYASNVNSYEYSNIDPNSWLGARKLDSTKAKRLIFQHVPPSEYSCFSLAEREALGLDLKKNSPWVSPIQVSPNFSLWPWTKK